MFDIWNNHISIVEDIYEKENYQIKQNSTCHNNTCYIFFSSNNIWYPNTEEAFMQSFYKGDYYEWQRFLELPAEKIVYVRDIYKSWYVTGINRKLNSIDSVIDFLKRKTSGMRVITVGSSAGGYMAALAAALLNAEYCICFSAQFDLTVDGALGVNPFLKKYVNDKERSQYYNIVDIIKKSKIDIFYFMPAFSVTDKQQMKKVADIKNVQILKIASHRHGVPLLTGNLDYLLRQDKNFFISLFDLKKEQIVGIIPMSVKLSGVLGTCICIKNDFIKKTKRYLRRYR